jgi:N-hydroxyarylamine O-acetyltransferase
MMDLSLYLQRIHYAGSLEPTIPTLRALHLAHLLAVPFENLDIHLGRPISLEQEALFDKIVPRRRGGFCYELNGLFAALLEALGFDVTLLSASDAHADGSFGPEFDHLTLRVRCTDSPVIPWLADVGWGDTFREPLRLDQVGEQIEGKRAYRIDRVGDARILWQRDYNGHWERQYRFTLRPRDFDDFLPMSHYHQTSPDSLFTRKQLCTLATVDGRITLDDSRLITTVDGVRQEKPIDDDQTYRRILEERFGIWLVS